MSPLLLHGNTNQYNINGHRDASHTDMLQLHFIRCREVSGAGGNMRGSRDFCQSYLVLSLFYSLQRGSNGLFPRKLFLYFTKYPEGVHYFPGGRGCQTFSRGGGPNAYFFRNPCTYLLFSRGGGCPDPPFPLWIRIWAMSS